ncbi:MAG: tetratricopeptide repeat protein [Myxococcota bacterium]|nr:tetratricopeptide repeat protein [Myxococcota bacterium]
MSPPPALRVLLATVLSVAIAFPPQLFAMGPLERNHPAVEEGMDAYQDGRFEDALAAFERAQQELPDRPVVQLDRGNALFKLGRMDEAKQAYQKAVELDRKGELQGKDYYNLGNAWAAMDNHREAISAYRRALTLNPQDELARHNLEVLLRKLPPPSKPTPDGGTDGGQDAGGDGGAPDAGQDGGTPDGGTDGGADAGAAPPDGGADGGAGDGGMGDGGQGDGGQGDGGSTDGGQGKGEPDQQDGGDGQPETDPQGDGGQGDEQDDPEAKMEEGGDELDAGVGLSKQDTERLLDAIRENEKNLQLWRFQQQQQKKRRPDGKDW